MKRIIQLFFKSTVHENPVKQKDFLNCFNFSAVKRLIVINRMKNKCTVYIYYVYINTNICMYIFKKNMLFIY